MALEVVVENDSSMTTSVDMDMEKVEELRDYCNVKTPKSKLISWVHNMQLSPELKAALLKAADVTVKIGGVIVKIGKKILDIIVQLVAAYPMTFGGMIVGFCLGALISSIPFIGWLFSWIIPVLAAAGMAIGFALDVHDKILVNKINSMLNREIMPMKTLLLGC